MANTFITVVHIELIIAGIPAAIAVPAWSAPADS